MSQCVCIDDYMGLPLKDIFAKDFSVSPYFFEIIERFDSHEGKCQ